MYAESNNSQGKESKNMQKEQPRCANCDIAVLWPPTVVQGQVYCCTGCAAGGPCSCDYSQYSSVTISGVIHYGIDSE